MIKNTPNIDVIELRETLADLHASASPERIQHLTQNELRELSSRVQSEFRNIADNLRTIEKTLDVATKKDRELLNIWSRLRPRQVNDVSLNVRGDYYAALAGLRPQYARLPEKIPHDFHKVLGPLAKIKHVSGQWLNVLENSSVLEVLEPTQPGSANVLRRQDAA